MMKLLSCRYNMDTAIQLFITMIPHHFSQVNFYF